MKLISSDYTEVYKNRTYLSESSNLIKNDLLQTIASDSPFANLNQKEYVINQALMQEVFSVPEDIRMPQTANSIKENVFFDVIEPRFRIHNLVLQKDLKQTLSVAINQFSSKVENVLQKWGVVARHPANNSSNQLLMLFHGAPGTGKTFAAEAIAGQLRKKIISTDISKISSRWVGQSEANIKELFNTYDYIYEQTDNPPILLFNEADQLLTKRIENPDHHTDIMHNSMQNLFLEAFESFSGILIATTNLKTNLDPAFDRRFHLKIEFPKPDYEERIELWKFHLGSRIPGVDKIPIELLAQTYHLTGGQINVIIHNACVEAASRPKREQKLMLKDLIKYCDLETNKAVKSKKIAGF
jgi:SpoVK/Ycf46/Vps4 family AAA+-type ATPase